MSARCQSTYQGLRCALERAHDGPHQDHRATEPGRAVLVEWPAGHRGGSESRDPAGPGQTVSFYLPREVVEALRAEAKRLDYRGSISDVVSAALRAWLGRQPPT